MGATPILADRLGLPVLSGFGGIPLASKLHRVGVTGPPPHSRQLLPRRITVNDTGSVRRLHCRGWVNAPPRKKKAPPPNIFNSCRYTAPGSVVD